MAQESKMLEIYINASSSLKLKEAVCEYMKLYNHITPHTLESKTPARIYGSCFFSVILAGLSKRSLRVR
jgi:hypothetical protein